MQEPKKEEINHQTLKLLVGVIAISLGTLTNLFADKPLESISASYWAGGVSQILFVGFLFAIAAFLIAYNGFSKSEMVLSKVAAIAAMGVAAFPCECDGLVSCFGSAKVKNIHGISAFVMFSALVVFCGFFYQRAKAKGYPEAKRRQAVYFVCGSIIVAMLLSVVLNWLLGRPWPRIMFYAETIALVFFGISWLTASRVLPLLSRDDERLFAAPVSNSAARSAA